MDRTFGLGCVLGSSLLFAGLLATLAFWYGRKRSLSVEPIGDRGSEVLFWIAVLFSKSLGTAFGEAMIDPTGLTFAQGAVVCAGTIAVVLVLHDLTTINAAFLFWAAFVFTRPFGATFGNVLTEEHARGGLELGTLQTSLVATTPLVLVVYLILAPRRREPGARAQGLRRADAFSARRRALPAGPCGCPRASHATR